MIRLIFIFNWWLIFCVGFISCKDKAVDSSESNIRNKANLTELRGDYLGQNPPGETPELFAPGVVADIFREHNSTIFTPDGNEVFWTRSVHIMTKEGRKSRLVVAMHMKQENGVWIKPELASFNADRWTFVTCISPDGKHLFFDSTRPIEGNEEHVGTWVVDKTNDGWGEPKLFTKLDGWGIPVSKVQLVASGNIYFQSKYPKPNLKYESWGVGFFRSKLVNGEYQHPEMLDSTINTTTHLDYGFHISPDEKFVIFASDRPGGYSSLDLYISYHQKDDSWSRAINLGEQINTHGIDGSDWPVLSPDGKYLFFMTTIKPQNDIDKNHYVYKELWESQLSITNGDSKIHWVSARFIDELKPEELKQ